MSENAEARRWQIEIHDRIEPLEADWRALEDTGCCTLFQSYDWLDVWYRVTSRHGVAEPVIVTARRPGATATEAIFPLCRLRRRFHSEIAFADIMVTDFVGPVFAPDALDGPAAVRSLWEAVVAALPAADVVRFEKIAATVGDRRNPLLDLDGVLPFPHSVWGLELEPGTAAVPPEVPEAMVQSTEKRRAALERKFGRTVTWNEDPEELPELFDEVVALRTERADQIGRDEILTDPVWNDFYRELVASRHGRAQPVITRLEVKGQTVATMLAVGYRRALHYLVPSFAMKKWSRYTPGFQMLFDALEDSSARGYRYFDLTIGDEPYKQAFGARRRPLYQLWRPRTARGVALTALWRLRYEVLRRPRMASLARTLLRPVRT